jgi:prepilin-type N-terminal cleavage/methylation domain-containing protein
MPSAHRRAFTLVEMVVAVGIVVILVALTVSASVVIVRRSEVRETENMLRLLETAMLEWEQTVDRKLTWGEFDVPDGARYEIYEQDDWPDGPTAVDYDDSMATMLRKIEQLEQTSSILAQMDTDFLERQTDPNDQDRTILQVRDPWGTVIVLLHPGRVAEPQFPFEDDLADADPDGTIRVGRGLFVDATAREDRLGICRGRKVCFVSAGPDGEFGDLHLDVAESSLAPGQLDDVRQADDNIYSYELSRERPGP